MSILDLCNDNIREIVKYLNPNDRLNLKVACNDYCKLIKSPDINERIQYLFEIIFNNIYSVYKYDKYSGFYTCQYRKKKITCLKLAIGKLRIDNLCNKFKENYVITGNVYFPNRCIIFVGPLIYGFEFSNYKRFSWYGGRDMHITYWNGSVYISYKFKI